MIVAPLILQSRILGNGHQEVAIFQNDLPGIINAPGPQAHFGIVRQFLEEARPIVDELLNRGWDDEEFLKLCREHNLLPTAANPEQANP